MVSEVDVYETEEGLRKLAIYLRGGNGIKVRHAVEHEKRVDFFKGSKLVTCLLEAKKWGKDLPKVTTEAQALELGLKLLKAGYFHRSEKVPDVRNQRTLKFSQKHGFESDGYYTWMFDGPQTWTNLMTALLIFGFLFFTCFPIWPYIMKVWLWYASVTFLSVTVSFMLLRFLLFLLLWVFGYDFWVFPRLFDESLGFVESWTPLYSFEKSADGQGYYRLALVMALVGFIYWAHTQPTEFDNLIEAQKQFVSDIYAGKLLDNVAQEERENIDKPRVPNLEELMKEMEEEEERERLDAMLQNMADETDVDVDPLDAEDDIDTDVDAEADADTNTDPDVDGIDDENGVSENTQN